MFYLFLLGSPNRQSPVLNLSKSGGNTDQGSNCDERSERSEMHSPVHSVRDDNSMDGADERSSHHMVATHRNRSGSRGAIGVDDDDEENLSDDNGSEVDDGRMGKDDDGK